MTQVNQSLSVFQALMDMAQSIKDINDAPARHIAVINLSQQILTAQSAQTTLIQQIGQLEEKVRNFETWDTEKNRYELKNLGWGSFAYMLKPDARGTAPAHWVCTNCYSKRSINLIQHTFLPGRGLSYACPTCNLTINPQPESFQPGTDNPRWLDDQQTQTKID